jgi:hypothetical protein
MALRIRLVRKMRANLRRNEPVLDQKLTFSKPILSTVDIISGYCLFRLVIFSGVDHIFNTKYTVQFCISTGFRNAGLKLMQVFLKCSYECLNEILTVLNRDYCKFEIPGRLNWRVMGGGGNPIID